MEHSHVLLNLPVGKNVFDRNVEFSHVVFAEPVLIPTDAFQEGHAGQRHVQAYLPFRVQRLANGRRRLFRISKADDKVLDGR